MRCCCAKALVTYVYSMLEAFFQSETKTPIPASLPQAESSSDESEESSEEEAAPATKRPSRPKPKAVAGPNGRAASSKVWCRAYCRLILMIASAC